MPERSSCMADYARAAMRGRPGRASRRRLRWGGDTARFLGARVDDQILPHRLIRRRSVRARLKRRARELSLLRYQEVYRRMELELARGELRPDLIEAWEPTQAELEAQLDAVGRGLGSGQIP